MSWYIFAQQEVIHWHLNPWVWANWLLENTQSQWGEVKLRSRTPRKNQYCCKRNKAFLNTHCMPDWLTNEPFLPAFLEFPRGNQVLLPQADDIFSPWNLKFLHRYTHMEKQADVIQKTTFVVSEVHFTHTTVHVPVLCHCCTVGTKRWNSWGGKLLWRLHCTNAAESSVPFIAPHQPFVHNYGIFPACSLHHAKGHNVFSSIRNRWQVVVNFYLSSRRDGMKYLEKVLHSCNREISFQLGSCGQVFGEENLHLWSAERELSCF